MNQLSAMYHFRFLILAVCFILANCRNPEQQGELVQITDWTLGPFHKLDDHNPIMISDPGQVFYCPIRKEEVRWEEKDVFNPSVIVKDDTMFMIYRAEDTVGKHNGTSRLGLAYSLDGYTFHKYPKPVLYPDEDEFKIFEWEGGIEDPRVVESPDGKYIMTYTSYDGNIARLCLASSANLRTWKKYGPMLKGTLQNTWTKSGSIVCEFRDHKFMATKINGYFRMYFGDTDIYLARSTDLIHWEPDMEDAGSFKKSFSPRPNMFDSDLVEPGPQAVLTDQGIILIYNGRNYGPDRIDSLPEGCYSGGQILFDTKDPGKVLKRTDEYFIRPDRDFEIEGQVNQVVFLEGLAYYKEKLWLYYGTADSRIGVAYSETNL